MRLTLLCTGDLHLGRFPSRVSSDQRGLAVEHVWQEIVTEAIRRRVDAVVLTGDVADRSNAFFEAFGALRREVERLIAAGIPTFAVAGNHDFEVLGRLVDALDTPLVRLVGREATWEVVHLEKDGRPVLAFVGWSFRMPHVSFSPLKSFPDHLGSELPLVGLLHADLDQRESVYAPVQRAELFDTPVPVWLLGHIHRPQRIAERGRHILYPGSPQPLHPGETGAHGPWLIEFEDGERVRFEHLPLASLRYEPVEVEVPDAADLNELQALAVRAVTEQLRPLPASQPSLRHLVARVTLTGRTPHHRALALAAADWGSRMATHVGDTGVTVDRLSVDTRPVYDLAEVATRKDPAGALAELLVGVESGDGQASALVRAASAEIQGLVASNAFRPLADRLSPDDLERQARERVVRQGMLLLDALIEQAESEEAA